MQSLSSATLRNIIYCKYASDCESTVRDCKLRYEYFDVINKELIGVFVENWVKVKLMLVFVENHNIDNRITNANNENNEWNFT